MTWSSAIAMAPRVSAHSPNDAPTISGSPLGGRQRGALERVPHRRHEDLARLTELAADDDELRIEEVAQARGGDADVPAGVRDDPPRALVAGVDAWSRSLSRCMPSLGGNSDSRAGPPA